MGPVVVICHVEPGTPFGPGPWARAGFVAGAAGGVVVRTFYGWPTMLRLPLRQRAMRPLTLEDALNGPKVICPVSDLLYTNIAGRWWMAHRSQAPSPAP